MTAVLAGRTVMITGGSMGIGFACAQAALAAGANIVIAARGESALARARDELAQQAGDERVLARACDVAQEMDVDALFDATLTRYGTVDGVVHAAAVIGPIGAATDTDAAAWFDAVRVDLFGTFLVARSAARIMMKAYRGKIVLLSGGGATTPFPNYSAYAASKAAVVRFAETLALELAPYGVDVNALAPGFVATRMHEATLSAGGRAGTAYLQHTREQLATGGVPAVVAAAAAVFLLSSESDGIRGRLLAAPWDDWRSWPSHAADIDNSDVFTLRRIVPRDRGMAWQ